jgi:hypothetical protein
MVAASDRAQGIVTSAKPQTWTGHPFVARLVRVIELGDDDLDSLWELLEAETTVPKRRDLVIDGYEFRKLSFVEDGFAARYKLLRKGKRQIINFVLLAVHIGWRSCGPKITGHAASLSFSLWSRKIE